MVVIVFGGRISAHNDNCHAPYQIGIGIQCAMLADANYGAIHGNGMTPTCAIVLAGGSCPTANQAMHVIVLWMPLSSLV